MNRLDPNRRSSRSFSSLGLSFGTWQKAALDTMTGPDPWRPIADAQPGRRYDVWVPSVIDGGRGHRVADCELDADGRWYRRVDGKVLKPAPTHFMEVPGGPRG